MVVLAIDDDSVSRVIIKAALRSSFTVVIEESGARAVLTAEQCLPQLILLDLNMPNVDGYEVLRLFKHHPTLSSVPVICLSGHNDDASRTRAYNLGASGFLGKPIDVKTIANDIEQLISRMNNEIVSPNGKGRGFIGRNSNAEQEKVHASLDRLMAQEKTVVMLSFLNPEHLFTESQNALLRSGKLHFLQVKPSLMARLPYLQELVSVVDDIKMLTRLNLNEATLLVDGLERLFDLSNRSQSLRVGLALGETLSRHFQAVEYFSSYPRRDDQTIESLNEVVTALLGHRNAA
jgi:CheY-like chemotaxis protein